MGVRLDAPGQWQGLKPSSVRIRHREVKQGQSRGSVGSTYEGKRRVCRDIKIGQAGRGRAQVERERVQGKDKGKWREANRRRQPQTAIHPGVGNHMGVGWNFEAGVQ